MKHANHADQSAFDGISALNPKRTGGTMASINTKNVRRTNFLLGHLAGPAEERIKKSRTCGCCAQHYVLAHNPRAVLLRQKSICDNQCHHARENQQCRKGFSDHWPRRIARSRQTRLRFRPSLRPHAVAL